ncbi:MAG: hypothetical protein J6Q54_01495, partial [Oscillospiraceae bacterium]|nr:hypothetical protein [Oscillospiraceae bacterium]
IAVWVKTSCGGILMNSQQFWQAFLDTGAPEMYLLYSKARKLEASYVLENQGLGTQSGCV